MKVSEVKKWEKLSKEELALIIQHSKSYREVAAKCGYSIDGGGSIKSIKEMIDYYQFDVSHFLGQGWNRDNFDYSRFQKGRAIKAAQALEALIALRTHCCEKCKNTFWNNEKIPLEVHHLDGDSLNNELENLQLLCPNCHAQTENWRGKNRNKDVRKEEISEEKFAEALRKSSSIRQALISLGLSPKGGNYSRAYEISTKYGIEKFIK